MKVLGIFPYKHTNLINFDETSVENVTPTFSENLITRTKNINFTIFSNSFIVEDITHKDIFCKRCGRLLKDDKSCILGMGPTCYKKYKLEKNKCVNLFYMKKEDIDGSG